MATTLGSHAIVGIFACFYCCMWIHAAAPMASDMIITFMPISTLHSSATMIYHVTT